MGKAGIYLGAIALLSALLWFANRDGVDNMDTSPYRGFGAAAQLTGPRSGRLHVDNGSKLNVRRANVRIAWVRGQQEVDQQWVAVENLAPGQDGDIPISTNEDRCSLIVVKGYRLQ